MSNAGAGPEAARPEPAAVSARRDARRAATSGGDGPASGDTAGRGSALRQLLRVPLFYKILVANAAIVVLGAVLGTLATIQFLRSEPGHSPLELVVPLAVVGVSVTVLVNALILRLALRPISQLEATAAQVQAGNLAARVPDSPLADRQLQRLTRTFNAMLDRVAEYRQRTRDVAARALGAEEEERKRIARELHDETAQSLAALLIRLRLARGVDDPVAREALLEEIRAGIGAALEGIRRFARGLRPPALDELGLVPAIDAHVRQLSDAVGLPIQMEAEPLDDTLWPQAELALYRIVQEALSNAVRHAAARRVRVVITRTAQRVSVVVEDDGRGFDPANAMAGEGAGLGLYGMQERAAYIGGDVTIDSVPGRGTRVRAEIPLSDTAGYG